MLIQCREARECRAIGLETDVLDIWMSETPPASIMDVFTPVRSTKVLQEFAIARRELKFEHKRVLGRQVRMISVFEVALEADTWCIHL